MSSDRSRHSPTSAVGGNPEPSQVVPYLIGTLIQGTIGQRTLADDYLNPSGVFSTRSSNNRSSVLLLPDKPRQFDSRRPAAGPFSS